MTNKGVVGQRTWACLKGQGLEQAWFFNLYFMSAFTLVLLCPSLRDARRSNAKLHAKLLNSRWIGAFSLLLQLQFGNLQPEMEINEYSSSKKLLE